MYNPFVDNYLNFIDPLRTSLISGAKYLLSFFGVATNRTDAYTLTIEESGESIRMVYSCVGYGIMSFWIAFVLANKGELNKKLKWTLFGLLILWIINVLRFSGIDFIFCKSRS